MRGRRSMATALASEPVDTARPRPEVPAQPGVPSMPLDPHESVHAALRGDRQAFDSLFGRNLPRLMAYIRLQMSQAVGARESVSDIAQSVCREVLQDMDGFEFQGDEAFRKWLMMQATRKLIDKQRFYRRARRDIARERAPEGDASDSEANSIVDGCADLVSPSRLLGAREQLGRIQTAIGDLPDKQRDAVMMAKVMGMTTDEVAQELGTTAGAVRSLIARGLAKLSLMMRPE
ncbi:MAG: sigma-70 family RNA polymerase sigma factor [Planctomycetota bacterium]